jgi:glutathione peroxidase-family protein
MKFLTIMLGLGWLNMTTNSFYDIKFEALDGTVVKTSSFEGKMVIIAVVSANPDAIQLVRYLDSVQKANKTVQVIAIPTADFKGDVRDEGLRTLKVNTDILITRPLKVKKNHGAEQHPLFAWLTQAKQNSHFDTDVNNEGQLFFVSGKGTLYSVLQKGTPTGAIGKIINRSFAE